MAALPVSTHKYLTTKGLHIYMCYIAIYKITMLAKIKYIYLVYEATKTKSIIYTFHAVRYIR